VTGGKLFAQLFGAPYMPMMLLGAAVVIIYTLLGGFLAESMSDFVQGIVMVVALVALLAAGVASAGGFGAIAENIKGIPGFTSFFSIATPVTDPAGVQSVQNGAAQFGAAGKYGLLTIISTMSWGLGYFGMPQVLLRFFAIRKASELRRSRRIATVWCAISLAAACFIGLIGRSMYPTDPGLLTAGGAESVFITMAMSLFPTFLAGILMAGILAAVMSSSDSYLLIAASALAKNLYSGVFKKNARDKEVMLVTRAAVLAVAVAGILMALDQNSSIFKIVSFAWAGFGATFGPLVLFSLFWKRMTRAGAIGGMLAGGGMVFLWKLVVKNLGGVFGIYELLPAFILSCVAIVLVSLLTKKPDAQIEKEFEAAKVFEC
jgi:sodium/proline symporter